MKVRHAIGALLAVTVALGGLLAQPASANVRHHLKMDGAMTIKDDEDWPDSDHYCRNVLIQADDWADHQSSRAARLADTNNRCDGEIRVELYASATLQGEAFCNVQVEVLLYEGTSTGTSDLDGQYRWNSGSNCYSQGGWLRWTNLRVNNTDEGGDWVDLNFTVSHAV